MRRFSQRFTRRLGATFAGLLLATAIGGGCMTHVHHPVPKPVVVHHRHVHSARCGHFLAHGRWHHLRGHLHRRGCGHVFVAGVWRIR